MRKYGAWALGLAMVAGCGEAEGPEHGGAALPALDEWLVSQQCSDTWAETTLWRVVVTLPGVTDGDVFTVRVDSNRAEPNLLGCGASSSGDEEGLIDYVVDCSDATRESGVAQLSGTTFDAVIEFDEPLVLLGEAVGNCYAVAGTAVLGEVDGTFSAQMIY